jgi:serine protease Do
MTILLALFFVLLPVGHALAEPVAEPRAVLRAIEEVFTSVAHRVTPSVVNVSTVSKKGPGEDVPEQFREFLDEFKRRAPKDHPQATGSGVIVDPNGYILTNNHVIENASEITVRLSDARKFIAKLVGRDPKTDLAVLKVDAPQPLPAAELGDSDALRVGQWAIAIGNPFGLDRTVTVGIVSGTARSRVGVATYESFIQTDASINPGNSGGPLLDIDGRVIGVNTAIVAAGQGIGFAIPINMAKDVMRQLMAKGRVVRGWLGIAIQDLTDELAPSFGLAEREGVLVSDVMKGSPAESGGLQGGDVIVEFDGTPIKEAPDLQRRVAGVMPGQEVSLKVNREGRLVPLRVKVGEMPAEEPLAAAGAVDETWGLTVEPLTSDLARRLNLSVKTGVLVSDVTPDSAAARAGLGRGDVILEIDGQPVADAAALRARLDSLNRGDQTRIYVERPGAEGGRRFVVLKRPDAP